MANLPDIQRYGSAMKGAPSESNYSGKSGMFHSIDVTRNPGERSTFKKTGNSMLARMAANKGI